MRLTNNLQWGALIVFIFVFGIIGAGLFVSGSPLTARVQQRDTTRANHLSLIQSHLTTYWSAKGAIPDALDALNDPTRYISVPKDPSTGKSYRYEKTGNTTFRLCAEFEREGETRGRVYTGENGTWRHGKGLVCFERSIDPDFYPQKQPTSSGTPLPSFGSGIDLVPAADIAPKE